MRALVLIISVLLPGWGLAENLAITFDDLPLNGTLAPGMDRALDARHIPYPKVPDKPYKQLDSMCR